MLTTLKAHFKRIRRFSFIGLINAIIDFSVYGLLIYFFSFHHVLAHLCAFMVANINSFFCNAIWTFDNLKKDQLKKQMLSFYKVTGIGLILSTATVYLGEKVIAPYFVGGYGASFVAKVIAMFVSLIWNYLGSWFFVFKEKEEA